MTHPVLRRAAGFDRALLATAALSAAAFAVALVGLAASSERITGVDAWLKPAKFGVSIVIYVLTLPEPLATGIRDGLLVALLGMAEAGLMIANRDWQSGGGHTVGARDGGPGLPILGWSTQHGDLRAAHFVGLHALQALPIIAWAIGRLAPRPVDVQRNLARLAVVAAAGSVVLLAWQAERGRPLLHPDAPVVLAALAGVAVLAAAVAAALRRERRPVQAQPGVDSLSRP